MSRRTTPRTWIWAALDVQLAGPVFDAAWHGLNRDFKAVTVGQMITHLSTVHLPIYVGVVSVLLTTAWALLNQMRRSGIGIALPIAVTGALISTAGEGWHACTHLPLSTHSGPIAATTALGGFTVVVTALWLNGPRGRRRAADDIDQRRAA